MALTSNASQQLMGRPEGPVAPLTLTAGPVTALLDGADLRRIRVGDTELVQRVYVAVRDAPWNTIPAEYDDWTVEQGSDTFVVRFRATHRHETIDFTWQGTIFGTADDERRRAEFLERRRHVREVQQRSDPDRGHGVRVPALPGDDLRERERTERATHKGGEAMRPGRRRERGIGVRGDPRVVAALRRIGVPPDLEDRDAFREEDRTRVVEVGTGGRELGRQIPDARAHVQNSIPRPRLAEELGNEGSPPPGEPAFASGRVVRGTVVPPGVVGPIYGRAPRLDCSQGSARYRPSGTR